MLLHILGASAVAPAPEGPCAGYLLQTADGNVLLDCGPGVLAPLRAKIRLADLDGILLSHAHPDHCLDLIMLRQAMAYDPSIRRDRPLPVWCGPSVVYQLERIGEPFAAAGTTFWEPWLELHTFDPNASVRLAGIEMSFARTNHPTPCWAVRCSDAERVLVYSADTGPSASVEALCRDADLLLVEATLPTREGNEDATGHLAAAEAGAMSARAGGKRLLLTHTFAAYGARQLAAAAAEACPGTPVAVARAGDTWRL